MVDVLFDVPSSRISDYKDVSEAIFASFTAKKVEIHVFE